jgi:hypothetical protein
MNGIEALGGDKPLNSIYQQFIIKIILVWRKNIATDQVSNSRTVQHNFIMLFAFYYFSRNNAGKNIKKNATYKFKCLALQRELA